MADNLYWGLRLAFGVSPRIPLAWRYRIGMVAGEGIYWCWPAKRRATRRTMAVVTGDRAEGRHATRAARRSLRNYGRYVVDFLNLPSVPPREIVARSRVTGWEHLDRVLEHGKGAIFVTGHFGLWDYAPALLDDRYPGRVYVVAEEFSSPRVDALIQGQRREQGSTVIPMTNVRAMVRALKGNGIVCLLVDRPVTGDGVEVEFFGQRTRVPAGAATLAALTGATLLPGYMIHHRNGGYEAGILPAIEPAATGRRASDVQDTTQQVFAALERIIMRSIPHWYMFRDMWASRGAARMAAQPAEAAV